MTCAVEKVRVGSSNGTFWSYWCLLGGFGDLLITMTRMLPQFSVLYTLVLLLLPKTSKNKKLLDTNVVLRIRHSLFGQRHLAAP